MKSKLIQTEIKSEEIKFPCLMICKDKPLIIIATSYANDNGKMKINMVKGTVVYSEKTDSLSLHHEIGYHSTWWLPVFGKFDGKIELSNI